MGCNEIFITSLKSLYKKYFLLIGPGKFTSPDGPIHQSYIIV